MKKSNINVLLVALTSAVALAACGSGSSSSPAPTPSPTPTPSPSPAPTPSPTPTPAPDESGVYALAGSGINVTYSTTPSTNTWVNFVSGTNQPFVTAVASESAALLLSTSTNNGLVTATTNTTLSYGIYGTAGAQVASQNTSIPVTVTVNTTDADDATITLPAIPATQIASNGSNAVVVTPSAASVTGGATPVIATATSDTYNLYTISAAGVATALTGYYNLSGAYTTLPAGSVLTNAAVFFVNGMYYAYNVTANNQLLQSKDGVTWQQITNNTALNAGATYLANVVQVSGSVFAAVDEDGGLYLGSSPANLTFVAANTIVAGGFIAANGTGSLYISNNDATTAGNLKIYTPTASTLGSAVATSSVFTNIPNSLVFAGNNIYSVDSQNGYLSALTVSGPTITQAITPASLVNATGAISSQLTTSNSASAPTNGYFAMGSNILALNTNTNSTGNAGTITMVSTVATNGALTYNNLPTGNNVLAKGFAGTTSGYMLVLNNGDVLVSSANGFVQATTVLNPSNGEGAALATLVSTNGTYLADDNNNLYYSVNNGSTWTTITPDAAGAGTGTLNVSSAANGLYFITVAGSTGTLTDGLYQTATPQTLSTWVQVNSVPTQSQPTYWGGTYYLLGYGAALNNTNVGVYNPATGQIVANDNVLPQSTNGKNISYNGSTFGLAQLNSNYLWTSTNLLAGPSAWTQNVATFTGVNGVSISGKFSSSLAWNGKVWVATVTALAPNNLGAPVQANLYTAKDATAFAVGTYTSPTGVTTAVGGNTTGLF